MVYHVVYLVVFGNDPINPNLAWRTGQLDGGDNCDINRSYIW